MAFILSKNHTGSFYRFICAVTVSALSLSTLYPQGFEGFYQHPEIHGNTIYFVAEGDLWKVSGQGGLAQRITTHHGEESDPVLSPDGKTLAFTANYEGPAELYTMPADGGLPVRWTYESETSTATCWQEDHKLIYTTSHYSTLPGLQLVSLDLSTKLKELLPLSQASEASFSEDGKTVYFVRPAYHRNVTKRYKGGTARKIWKYTEGTEEAVCLTHNYDGESHHPVFWKDRVYFLTDRDEIMNIWSMDQNGGDVWQHTYHEKFDVRDLSVHDGKIAYQTGADIWIYHILTQEPRKVPIMLTSDLDQLREKWVEDPKSYITSANLHPEGEKLLITARGRVFSVPVKSGRLVQVTKSPGIRYRDAVYSASGNEIIVLSDESGEFEFQQIPVSGIGDVKNLTNNGKILRYQGFPSPDGKWLAFDDLGSDMWVMEIAKGEPKLISTNQEGIRQIAWSPDSRWVAFVQVALNTMSRIFLYNVETGERFPITTDRANSMYPQWSHDGKWIYFLSDRNFRSLVESPWGPRQPEPYFDQEMKIYYIPLQKGFRSPFRESDELFDPDSEKSKKDTSELVVEIHSGGIEERIAEVPVKPGNYRQLAVNDKALYFLSSGTGLDAKIDLMAFSIANDEPEASTIVKEVRSFELSQNGKKITVRKGQDYYVFDAGTKPVSDLNDSRVDLSGWKFSLDIRQDWKQIFTDAWRMERDYFYDHNMHGVNWDAMYERFLPLVDRVTTRNELSDLIGRFVGELSALHTSVRGGDMREGKEDISVPGLGARMNRADAANGYVIRYIYQGDPDYPDEMSPLSDPYLDIATGDIILAVNGVPALTGTDIGELLRNQEGQQVRLKIRDLSMNEDREVIVKPISNEGSLRYRDWEYTRRKIVESRSDNQIGYVHLRAMGSNDLSQWYREFYPVFNRPGLIIDVRHNRGGNIESFILEKLMRKAWMYWKTRSGEPYWNMQYAFRGHIVVLVDQNTASDGEAFADGFRRLGLGTTIGTRTWGGEIWLSSANRLTDGGLARAPMMGVYGPEGEWLIEGHGFVPDIIVDNLPHATYMGEDAQLEAAIDFLHKQIEKDPRKVPPAPPYPDKSFETNRK